MESLSTLKNLIVENFNNKHYINYVPHSVHLTPEIINDIFNEENCTVLKSPKYPHEECNITFYRNDNPERIMTAHLNEFCVNPKNSFPKSRSKLNTSVKAEENLKERLEKQRQNKEEELRQSMKNEDCELISKYTNYKTPVYYLFEGMEYKTTPNKWHSGHRAHKCKCIRYTQNYIKQLFENEGCELISEYQNQKSKLKYLYKDKEYEVVFNDWKYFNKRPHLVTQ